jgi:hypothetical protein
VSAFDGVQAIFYDFHPYTRAEFVWDARMRRLSAGPQGVEAGLPVTIATNGPGYGTEGVQRRVTAAATGAAGSVIAVWSQHAQQPCQVPREHPGEVRDCGPRPVFASLSPDLGASWGPPSAIAAVPDHDLVNPFAIMLSPDDLRVYFTVDRFVPDVGYVRSADHGVTWTPIQYVAIPRDLTPARMVFQVDPAHGLVAVLTSKGFDRLVTLLVEKLPPQTPSP